jgi:hypothetical protein
MDAIYASDHQRMKGFSMKWQSTIGDFAFLPFVVPVLCTIRGNRVVTHADYPLLEKIAENAIKDRQKFERLLVSKKRLLEMFHVSREQRYLRFHTP